jgi:hypothetical protein
MAEEFCQCKNEGRNITFKMNRYYCLACNKEIGNTRMKWAWHPKEKRWSQN